MGSPPLCDQIPWAMTNLLHTSHRSHYHPSPQPYGAPLQYHVETTLLQKKLYDDSKIKPNLFSVLSPQCKWPFCPQVSWTKWLTPGLRLTWPLVSIIVSGSTTSINLDRASLALCQGHSTLVKGEGQWSGLYLPLEMLLWLLPLVCRVQTHACMWGMWLYSVFYQWLILFSCLAYLSTVFIGYICLHSNLA